MLNTPTVGAFSGLGIVMIGVYCLRRMQASVFGGWNRVRVTRDLTGKYKALIREGKAPLWPLIIYRVCIPLGTVIAFGSVFLTKTVR